MDLPDLKNLLATIESDARAAIAAAATIDALRAAESKISKGPLADALKSIKQIAPDQRGPAGQAINATKNAVAELFAAAMARLREADVAGERRTAADFDPTLPPPLTPRGSLHPVTAVQREVERIFTGLGFAVVGGPEMETDFYNFEALNIPPMHPARDAQDTFWLTNGWLLRTHTSPCQVRAMKRFGPPIRVIAPGRCFRYEAIDASHENTFHQLEGLLIDKDISVAHLIAFMKLLLREVFQRDVKVRLRPGFFPFVEPGFELDMSCAICNGTAVRPDGEPCATCKRSGWVEILPCGMVHPNVLRHGGIDPHEYTGFAFGLGLTRLAMMKYGIADIRILNSGDLRGIVHPERLKGPSLIRQG
ncbi:MAG: phenylalanine--tRNA ligase alpha subunit [Phycisphaerae bacterium]|nr:MAG: phenylalanine--tRNA ligase subunit alpha [Planctomycetia bacterium]RIK70668.1 MAG: phenylalanine--tRNA ligase subunit alpha [Planctomycetota bacterium]GJQ26354.1 MAG: phenylalanine--tRNA ligase alpha subunit [Phycisphaerae bacterium]